MGVIANINPSQKLSNNRQVVGLKLYRKEASINKALLWFVRCLQRQTHKDMTQSTQLSLMFVWFQKLNLRGRNKAKKSSAGEALDEQENRSLVMETEMDRLRLGADEEEEEDEGSGRRASLQRREEDAQHQRSFLFERRASDEHREEETDVDESPLSKLEKSVRWTDFCQKCDGGVKEEVRGEERIKQQLFSGVC